MANVRVKYVGKLPIIIQDKTWYEDEVHEIDEKLSRALLAFGEQIVMLPVAGGETAGETTATDEASADDAGETGAAGAPDGDAGEVVVEEAAEEVAEVVVEEAAPKAKRKR